MKRSCWPSPEHNFIGKVHLVMMLSLLPCPTIVKQLRRTQEADGEQKGGGDLSGGHKVLGGIKEVVP